MYSRIVQEAPKKIVEKGKARFGTYKGVPSRIDIRGMHAPYAGVPLPAFISNLRIKSRLNFIFSTEKIFGITEFYDFKAFGLSNLIFWNKETGKKHVYRTFIPLRKRIVPKNTKQGNSTSFRKSCFIRVSWGREHQHHALSFKTKKNNMYPAAEAFIHSSISDNMHTDLLFVNPSPASSRCTATWFTPMQIHGIIKVNGTLVDDSNGLASMMLNRSYVKMHSRMIASYGYGKIKDKNIVFQLKTSNLDAADSDNFNENVLIVDGEETTLPPVYMTHPLGINKTWIIQDTESMVDLTFTPCSQDSKTMNIVVFRISNTAIYGTFDGVLLTKDGEKINLKNIPGLIYRSMFRL